MAGSERQRLFMGQVQKVADQVSDAHLGHYINIVDEVSEKAHTKALFHVAYLNCLANKLSHMILNSLEHGTIQSSLRDEGADEKGIDEVVRAVRFNLVASVSPSAARATRGNANITKDDANRAMHSLLDGTELQTELEALEAQEAAALNKMI